MSFLRLMFDYSAPKKQNYQQRHFHLISGIILIFFLSLSGNSIAEEKVCEGLKKINNLDELLYQLYINLDSDCLFEMPISELEAIWGIKIFTEERLQPGQPDYQLRWSSEFSKKPYNSEADAFYVEAKHEFEKPRVFYIYISEKYNDAHATLFPSGKYPSLLPEPTRKIDYDGLSYKSDMQASYKMRRPKNPGKYNNKYMYFWITPDQKRMIYFTPSARDSVSKIMVVKNIPSRILYQINKQSF